MSSRLGVAVLGATGALGGEIVRVLDQVSWRPERLVALARQTTSTSHVDYGDERVPVDIAEDRSVDGIDVLFVAAPADASRSLVAAAMQRGVLVVDCAGALDEPSVPLVVPWVNPEALAMIAAGVVRIPDAATILLSSVLGPLRRAGIVGSAQAVVLAPASLQGREGIEELSRQVVALFNSGTPSRRVFPEGLAFDLLPAIGAVTEEGWTGPELAVAAATCRVAGTEAGALDVSMVGVPVFSGISAHLSLSLSRAVLPELVLRILKDGGVQLPEAAGSRYLPRPRRVEGKPFVHVARVRIGADERTLHLWLAMDNLRTTATAAVAAAGAITRGGAPGSDE